MDNATDTAGSSPYVWENHEGFRETLLRVIPDGEEAQATRQFGAVFFRMLLERSGPESESGESSTKSELGAAAKELRHLEAYLADVGRGWKDHCLDPADTKLSKFAGRLARHVGEVADQIERAVRGEIASRRRPRRNRDRPVPIAERSHRAAMDAVEPSEETGEETRPERQSDEEAVAAGARPGNRAEGG